MVLLSQPSMTTGKTIALAVWVFVSKVISLLFNTLSRFVIAFLPRSKHLLISMSIVIWEPKKIKSISASTFSLLGARVRYSTHGKGHEEGGSTYAKQDLASGVPLEILKHLPP